MSKRLHQDLKEQEYLTKTISITLRDSDFKTITRSKSIDYTDSLYEINDVIEDLLYDNFIEFSLNSLASIIGLFKPL